ncbi:MAG: YihY/virulence factor BrkB family protein [Clostridiales bacterium]|nr:YihY/virulence factor BrkB family protein [Clostridiales bacterium]
MKKMFDTLEKKYGESKVISFIKELYFRFDNDGVSEIGAQLTYYLILSIFPFLIFFLNFLSYTPLASEDVIERILNAFPSGTKDLLGNLIYEITSSSSYALISIGAIGGIWSSSNGVMSIIKAVNRAYDLEEDRPYWKLRGLSILFTIGLAIVLFVSLAIIVFGEVFLNMIFASYTWTSYLVYRIVQLLLTLLLICLVLSILYKFAPSIKEGVEIKIKDALPGGFMSTVLLILFSMAFSFYINNFGNYSRTYGSIGGIIVLLIWLYVSSIVIVLGAEINAVIMSNKTKREE